MFKRKYPYEFSADLVVFPAHAWRIKHLKSYQLSEHPSCVWGSGKEECSIHALPCYLLSKILAFAYMSDFQPLLLRQVCKEWTSLIDSQWFPFAQLGHAHIYQHNGVTYVDDSCVCHGFYYNSLYQTESVETCKPHPNATKAECTAFRNHIKVLIYKK